MSTIIKLQNGVSSQISLESVKINRLVSSITPQDFIKLLRDADNKVNPRSARVNPITKSIHETLEISPELFWYKSKGLLLATERCELLERNRVRLSFDNRESEGIMDGGHNTFAIASFLVESMFDKKLKDWDECKRYWDENYDEIVKEFEARFPDDYKFSIPVEIIYPSDDQGSLDQYYDYIAEICAARNNNVQLKETSKGNQKGLYDNLKELLGSSFDVIWKGGESGRIKPEDVLSMAAIPLLFLQDQELLPEDINKLNPISIYSYKSKCVDFINSVMAHESISSKDKGKHIVTNSHITSGLSLVEEIMRFFDKLYATFPNVYNSYSAGFGRIKSVTAGKPSRALFGTAQSDATYPPGFIYPLVTGVTELIELDSETDQLRWKVAPMAIDLNELKMDEYVDAIKLAGYDPQTVGKQTLFYRLAKSIFQGYIRDIESRP